MAEGSKSIGLVFALFGFVFSAIGVGMIVVQLAGEEFVIDVKGEGVPLGLEFAFVLFSFGLVFAFLGLAAFTASPRRRIVYTYFAGGTGIGAVAGVACLLLAAFTSLSLFGAALGLWLLTMLAAYFRAVKDPDYVHADRLRAFTGRVSGKDTFRAHEEIHSFERTAPDRGPAITQGLAVGAVLALFPAIFFGGFIATSGVFGLPEATFVLVPICLFSGLCGFALGYRGRRSIQKAAWALEALAERVNGTVVRTKVLWTERVEGVDFVYKGVPGHFRTESTGGEHPIIYSCVHFDLRHNIPPCRVVPHSQGTGRGKQDLIMGWDVFDDLFVVNLDQESSEMLARLRAALTRPVQERLLFLKQLAQERTRSGNADLVVSGADGGSLTVRLEGRLTEAEDLIALCGHACMIYAGMAAKMGSLRRPGPSAAPPAGRAVKARAIVIPAVVAVIFTGVFFWQAHRMFSDFDNNTGFFDMGGEVVEATVTVRDVRGNPVQGARVSINFHPEDIVNGRAAVTGRDGVARASVSAGALESGEVFVWVAKEGYAPAARKLSAMGDTVPETIVTLDEGGSITGRVTYLGESVEDATVSVYPAREKEQQDPQLIQLIGDGAKTVTNSAGEFRLTGLPWTFVELTCKGGAKTGIRSKRVDVTVSRGGGAQVNVAFEMVGEGVIQGRVAPPAGHPPRKMPIILQPRGDRFPGETLMAASQLDGSYRIEGLPRGEYLLCVHDPPPPPRPGQPFDQRVYGRVRTRTVSVSLGAGLAASRDVDLSGQCTLVCNFPSSVVHAEGVWVLQGAPAAAKEWPPLPGSDGAAPVTVDAVRRMMLWWPDNSPVRVDCLGPGAYTVIGMAGSRSQPVEVLLEQNGEAKTLSLTFE